MLVDTGPDPDRLVTLLDARLPAWDRRIDIVVLTHPHEDHVGGLAAAARALQRGRGGRERDARSGPRRCRVPRRARRASDVRRVPSPQATRSGSMAPGWTSTGRRRAGVPRHPARRRQGDQQRLDRPRAPLRRAADAAHRRRRGGDRSAAARRGLAARWRRSTCSRSPTTAAPRRRASAFLDALDPRIAVISVGWGNVYGHPAPATLLTAGRRRRAGLPHRPRRHRRRLDRRRRPARVEADDGSPAAPTRVPLPVPPTCRSARPAKPAVEPTIERVRPPAPKAAAIVREPGSRPTGCLSHSAAVAEIAAFLASSAWSATASRSIQRLVETAALLHDVDKCCRRDDALRCAAATAPRAPMAAPAWPRRAGCSRGASPGHEPSATRRATTRGRLRRAWPARVVAYADKRALQDLVRLDERFADWYRRYRPAQRCIVARERARRLEAELCAPAGRRAGGRAARARGSPRRCDAQRLTWPTSGARTPGRSSAPRRLQAELEATAGQPFDVWRTSGDEDEAAEASAGRRRERIDRPGRPAPGHGAAVLGRHVRARPPAGLAAARGSGA